jgi:hypothetical protein
MTPTNFNQPPARKGPAGIPWTMNDYNPQTNMTSTNLLLHEKPQKSENKNSHKKVPHNLNSAPATNQQSILNYMYHSSAPTESVSVPTTSRIMQCRAATLPKETITTGDAPSHLNLAHPSLTNNKKPVNANNIKKLNVPPKYVKHIEPSSQPTITKFLKKNPNAPNKALNECVTRVLRNLCQRQPFVNHCQSGP